MKRRPDPRRRPPRKDILPPDVPEMSKKPAQPKPPDEDLPDEIRKMLEAAYT